MDHASRTDRQQLGAQQIRLHRTIRHHLQAPRPDDPLLCIATPGLGKTQAFAETAARRLLSFFRSVVDRKQCSAEEFWQKQAPLYYGARTVGELAAVKETVTLRLTLLGKRFPRFGHWLSDQLQNLVVIAPSHLAEQDAWNRQKVTQEPLLHYKREDGAFGIPPDLCFRADHAVTLLSQGYHHLSDTICRNCPSANQHPRCGAKPQHQKALAAPVVLATVNRLAAEEDQLRYLHSSEYSPIRRVGFIDDYSEPLMEHHQIRTSQIDTWDWQLQQTIETGEEQLQNLQTRWETLQSSQNPDLIELALLQDAIGEQQKFQLACTLLHQELLPSLRNLYRRAAVRLSRMHHQDQKAPKTFLALAGMVPLTRSMRAIWRKLETSWSQNLPMEGKNPIPTLSGFLQDVARKIELPESLAKKNTRLPGAHLGSIISALENGAFSATWSNQGRHREVVVQATRVRPVWQRIRDLGYVVADATPDPWVEQWISRSVQIQAPLHPDSKVHWIHRSELTKHRVEVSRADRKRLCETFTCVLQGRATARQRRQALITYRELFYEFRQDHPELSAAYYGGGGAEGHRAHNAFVAQDLHLLGLPRLSPQIIASQTVVARQFRFLWPDAIPKTSGLADSYRPIHESVDLLGKRLKIEGAPEFADPLAAKISRAFTEREVVQSIHRSRPIHHPAEITIYAPAVTLDLARYGILQPDIQRRSVAAQQQGLRLVDLPNGNQIDLRVVAGLATASSWEERDRRGKSRSSDIHPQMPSFTSILYAIAERTGAVLHSSYLHEQLAALTDLAREKAWTGKRLWRWCLHAWQRVQKHLKHADSRAWDLVRSVITERLRYWQNRKGTLARRRQKQWGFLEALCLSPPAPA